ncbi:hypothetical protein SARC_02300 [Sphaeroforma arctica JP610]|uniref:ADP-ribosylation factor-related protein 1 n=1 Tax=Sphaeroforma arctica JP610 TaxID=667725 RepID=A0A0L0G9F1_9EUKA|nr:hypothetical protein SARC_02300 [Sphaeroforma arctica JP610]KNC85539.1 hypothetical protein SARC_02300 [Sphaeroforma arctica JP610]|eukprot:XP_014159441.1 hypothetical protein SARC_02300 [Sphaeroforma arctica JP610]
MYTLTKGSYKYLFQKDEYYVVVIGMDNAGKSTLVERFKATYNKNYRGFRPETITQTIGLNVARFGVSSVKLVLWDLGGQQDLHSIWEKYFAEAHGIIYVIDAADRQSLDQSRLAYNKMLQNADLADIPLLILVNKLDVPDPVPLADINAMFSTFASVIGDRPARVHPISAMTGDNCKEGVEWLVSCLKLNIRQPNQPSIS